jgi:hypothetical protein
MDFLFKAFREVSGLVVVGNPPRHTSATLEKGLND